MKYKHLKGLIIEGLSNSGKTSVFNSIKKHHLEYNERTILAFSENYSQVLYKHKGSLLSLDVSEHIELLQKRISMLKEVGEWGDFLGPASIASRGVFFLLERFHINHLNTFPKSNVENIELDLIKCNTKVILLTISPDYIYDRLRTRDKVSDDKTIYDKADRFVTEQEKYIKICKSSSLDTLIINTDCKEWDKYAI